MSKPTIHGALKGVISGRSYIKTRINRHTPKATIRRKATKAIGIPTTARGWKSASTHAYRYGQGCLVQVLTLFIFAVLLIILI